MRMVAARADSPLATPCTMTEETRELARGSPGDPARSGGRLKFFKDGKFILELVRSGVGNEGGGGWVSVPRKTFWPPAAAPLAGTPPHSAPTHLHARAERAASLSVSDDNSSVQSSPWQRDHCWKQTTPRKNISKELTLYYCRPSTLLNTTIAHASRIKRRKPYDTTHANLLTNGSRPHLTNGVSTDKPRNGDSTPDDKGEDAVDGARCEPTSSRASALDPERWRDRDAYYHMKLKKPYQYHKLRVYNKCRVKTTRTPLLAVVDKLREKVAALPVPVNVKLVSCRQEHALVSPRKRILRELERVSLEDQGGKRRARTAPALSTASYPPSPGPSHAPPAARHAAADTPPARTKHVSSYSIHSLLSMDDSPPDARRHAPVKTESPGSASPAPSPSPDHYRYRQHAALGSPSLPAYPAPAPRARSSPQHAPPDWYSYGYPPPFLPPHAYRPPPPPLPWVHYLPPGPWAPLQHPLVTHHIPKEEPSSDLPLNLSKH